MLATEDARVARRYARPFTIVRFTLNVEALRRKFGSVETDIVFRKAVDAIVEGLRASDFVSTAGASSIVVGFPETAAAGVAPIVERVRSSDPERHDCPGRLDVDVAEGDAITDLLAES